jgi:hypothetical protein
MRKYLLVYKVRERTSKVCTGFPSCVHAKGLLPVHSFSSFTHGDAWEASSGDGVHGVQQALKV